MADQNFDELRRNLVPAGTWGNVTNVRGQYDFDAFAEDDVVALCRVPANCVIDNLRYVVAALGASTAYTIGYRSKDGLTVDADAFVTVADSSGATSGIGNFIPLAVTKEGYITMTVTGAAAGAGAKLGDVVASYQYENL